MATPTIQQGRLITKRSAIPGTVPTVPVVDDIETFTPTDIFKGELFYNIPDNILYIRDNTGIIIISSGGAPIPYIYYTEVTTPGSEEAKIEVTDSGTNLSDIKVFPTSLFIESTDGINNNSIIFGADGTGGWLATDGTNNSTISLQPNNTEYYSLNGSVVSKVRLTAAGDAELSATDGTGLNSVLAQSGGGVISKAYDGSGNNSDIDIQYNSIISQSTDGTNTSLTQVVPTNLTLNSTDSTNDCVIDMGFNVLSISSNQITNDIVSRIQLDPANLASANGTYIRTEELSTGDYSQIKISNSDIILESTDGANTTEFSQTPTSFKISGIGSYSSDAAAGTAGLVPGNVYQTDGTGSGIFATPGILMIKQ